MYETTYVISISSFMNDLLGNIKYSKVEVLSEKLPGICQMDIWFLIFFELLITELLFVGWCRFVHMYRWQSLITRLWKFYLLECRCNSDNCPIQSIIQQLKGWLPNSRVKVFSRYLFSYINILLLEKWNLYSFVLVVCNNHISFLPSLLHCLFFCCWFIFHILYHTSIG
jgi:hypothetical protein